LTVATERYVRCLRKQHAMKAYGVLEVNIHASLNWALYGGESLALRFTPWERTPVHTGQKGLGASLASVHGANICSCRESNTDCPVTKLTDYITNDDTKLKCLNAGTEYSLQWRKPQTKFNKNQTSKRNKLPVRLCTHVRARTHARTHERTNERTNERALKRAFLHKISITAGLKCYRFQQPFYFSLLVKIFLSAILRYTVTPATVSVLMLHDHENEPRHQA